MNNELKILCPFCNAVWTAEMVEDLHSVASGCDTCQPDGWIDGTFEIKCSHCKRVVYKKEYTDDYI